MARNPGISTLDPKKVGEIVEMTEQGKFRGEIAETIECSKMTVYRWQKRLNLL